jgi:hypothetical protein
MPSVIPRIISPPFSFADLNTAVQHFTANGPIALTDGVPSILGTSLGALARQNDLILVRGQMLVSPDTDIDAEISLAIIDVTPGGAITRFSIGTEPIVRSCINHDSLYIMEVTGFGFMIAQGSPVIQLQVQIDGVNGAASSANIAIVQFVSA